MQRLASRLETLVAEYLLEVDILRVLRLYPDRSQLVLRQKVREDRDLSEVADRVGIGLRWRWKTEASPQFLREACARDPGLLEEVLGSLRASDLSTMSQRASPAFSADGSPNSPFDSEYSDPDQIGPYKILKKF